MDLSSLQSIALTLSIALTAGQLFVKNKTTAHVLFAVFSTSVALSLTQSLAGESVGVYQYLIGMGACFTCNGYWLFARSVFRKERALSAHHFAVAGVIALLIMANQGALFAGQMYANSIFNSGSLFHGIVRELTILLSSCILVLSFWEGCRGFQSADKNEKTQRVLFLMTFGGAVMISKVSQMLFAADPQAQQMTIAVITMFVLLNTQCLLIWRSKSAAGRITNEKSTAEKRPGQLPQPVSSVEPEQMANTAASFDPLAKKLEALIIDEALYLKPSLKMADLARLLNVSEYRVSKTFRHNLNARNFNQYINQFRIRHAQSLLADTDKQQWSVLVIGLESGFASVGPFTRAFKLITGDTPNQFRQKALKHPDAQLAVAN